MTVTIILTCVNIVFLIIVVYLNNIRKRVETELRAERWPRIKKGLKL